MLKINLDYLKQKAGLSVWVCDDAATLHIDFARCAGPPVVSDEAIAGLDDEQAERVVRRTEAMILGMRLANVLEQACEPPPGPMPETSPVTTNK